LTVEEQNGPLKQKQKVL